VAGDARRGAAEDPGAREGLRDRSLRRGHLDAPRCISSAIAHTKYNEGL
jgi:hypothetical protein